MDLERIYLETQAPSPLTEAATAAPVKQPSDRRQPLPRQAKDLPCRKAAMKEDRPLASTDEEGFRGSLPQGFTAASAPSAPTLPKPARRNPSRRLGQAKQRTAQVHASKLPDLPRNVDNSSADRSDIHQAPPSVTDIATHGELYEHITFTNIPQWIGANTAVWNAYRVASEAGDRVRQASVIADLLKLPARVLTKLPRGGTRNDRRITATIKARCRDVGHQIRTRYQCHAPHDHQPRLTLTTHTLHHSSLTTPSQRSTSTVSSTAATEMEDNVDSGDEVDDTAPTDEEHVSDSDEKHTEQTPRTQQHIHEDSVKSFLQVIEPEDDPDARAARRAQLLMTRGHVRKATQVLHSTTTMTDLRTPEAQHEMLPLHPPLPATSILPPLPADAPHIILQDDAAFHRLLRQTDNGSAAGPSGWAGNMMSTLVTSELCRLGILALLKDILNGNIPDDARELLLASRLVALDKPNGGSRPIAVGELFYRLAGVIAIKKVTAAAARLLSPHQYGVGVSSGAERILHSLQHSLTDKHQKLAMLKVDISNAFNTCDRARLLTELYDTPQLHDIYRIVDFGYSAPSSLLLQGCEGLSILSQQGVRQGDPLSALLFCLYMREVCNRVVAKAEVKLYGFFDDLNVVGKPDQVIAALKELQAVLPEVSLQFNTAKSRFVYFHDDSAPLMRSIRETLAHHNIECQGTWAEVMGAVVGKDENAVRIGINTMLGSDDGNEAFFRRLQFKEVAVQSAMLLLRMCAVPKMNYVSRCIAPSCITEMTEQFDEHMVQAAMGKLNIYHHERTKETTRILRAKMKHGGFGLTSATFTSPAAYIGSLAAIHDAIIFRQYHDAGHALPSDTLLHGWIESSMQLLQKATPDSSEHLPPSTSSFFHHYAHTKPTKSSSLQHTLSELASAHQHKASLRQAKAMRKQDKGAALAHAYATSASQAWTWKTVMPTAPRLTLADTQYRICARLNLRLQPFTGMGAVPAPCTLCKKKEVSKDDPWHPLSCPKLSKGEVSVRHDAVMDALYHVVLAVGGQAIKEAKGLQAGSNLRPDLDIAFPGRRFVTDVVVCHPLAPGYAKKAAESRCAVAKIMQSRKGGKYQQMAISHEAHLLPFAVETTGGLAPDALTLLEEISEAGSEHASMWPRDDIERYLLSTVAIAVMRGTAMTMLAGHMAAMSNRSKTHSEESIKQISVGKKKIHANRRAAEMEGEESEGEAEDGGVVE